VGNGLHPSIFFDIMELQKSPVRPPVRIGRPPAKAKVEESKNDTTEKIDLGFEIDPTKVYIFETLKKSEMPRYENLGASTKAFDPVEKRYRDIRYIATAPSIFPEEWDESFLERPEEPLGFYRNQITCSGQDIRKMEYLLNHPLYEHSPFRVLNRPAMYTIADKDVLDQIKAKENDSQLRALELIKTTDIDDLKPIARIIFGITETSTTAIQNALFDFVKKPVQGLNQKSNAEKLIDNLSNKKLQREFTIQSAIDRGIIVVNRDKMEARLSENNTLICQLVTKNHVKDITEYSYLDEGQKFYQILRAKI